MKLKKIAIFLFTFIFLFSISTCVFAESTDDFNIIDIFNKGKAYTDGSGDEIISSEQVADIVTPITNAGMAVGVVIFVASGLVLGINFITGGPEKMAQSKQQAIGLVVSGITTFGSFSIWKLVYTLLNNNIGK